MKKSSYLAVTLFALTSALPVAAFAANTQKYQFKGENASANFSSTDPTGCVVTDVSIWAGESVTKEGPGAPTQRTEAFAYVSKLDQCTWTYLFSGSGSTTSVASLNIDKTSSGSLDATIPIFDDVSGSTVDLNIDLTWTGAGEVYRGHNNGHDRFPGGRTHYRSSGSYRDAQVTGTVTTSLDPGRNLLAGASSFGQLSTSSSGSMQRTTY